MSLSSSPLLQLTDIHHSYGRFAAVRGVDLDIERGQVHCLLGPSGSGKSTLLRLTAGLETLSRGEIRIADRVVAKPGRHVRPEGRSVGMVFQDFALFPHLSVRRNVVFGMAKAAKAARHRRADELLSQVGMDGYANAMPHTLSGGQQQRVALARALAREPAVMLLDEPFSGLDVQLRQEVRDGTLEVLKQAGVATLMVTHDPQEALKAADRVSVIQAGRIVQSGSPQDLYHRSIDRRVAEIFGPVNVLSGRVENGLVKTVLGAVETPSVSEGEEVEVLVRPEDLRLDTSPYGSAGRARIESLTPGHGTLLVTVRPEPRPPQEVPPEPLQALDLARSRLRPGDTVYLSLAPDAAMVCRRAPG